MRMSPVVLSAVLFTLVPGAAPATAQNKQIELQWLRLAGATWGGQTAGEETGTSVAAAGDVNGDGFDDFLVGTWNADIGIQFDAGRVYLVYGGLGLTGTRALATAGVVFNGDKEDWHAGQSVAGVGDVNDDGYDDFLIGSPGAKTNNQTGSGRVYLVYGSPTLSGTIALATYTGGVLINGADEFDLAGCAVAGPGDVNGDGYPDLLIGASAVDNGAALFAGAAYIVYGGPLLPAAGGILDLDALTSATGVLIQGTQGSPAAENLGEAVGAAGDVNGDGYRDVLIGARLSDAQSPLKVDSGRAWIVYGGPALPATMSSSTLSGLGLGVTLNGQNAGDQFGVRVAGGGDVNGDGLHDVLVSAPLSDPSVGTGNDAGRSYLIYGSAALPATIAAGNVGGSVAGVVFSGIDGASTNAPSGDRAGNAIAAGGDFNLDGYDDLLIASATADANGDNGAGEVYLLEGGPALPAAFTLSTIHARGTVLAGVDPLDASGAAVSFAGDINGDDYPDLIIGAPKGDPPGGADAGETVLVYGTSHMIQAVGPVAEGGALNLRAHGAPGAVNLTFGTPFAILPPFQPLTTKFGKWWLISQLDLFTWSFASNGEMLFPLGMPAPGAVPGLVGLTIYLQTLGAPQGLQRDLTYLLGVTIE